MKKLFSNKGKYEKKKPPYLKIVLILVICIALAAVVLLNLFTHVFSVVQYYGESMLPELQDRQYLVVRKTDKVEQGDLVAFYYNNNILVRRVIAAGGSTVEIDEAGKVRVDGKELKEDYVKEPSVGQCNITFPHTVGHEEFFVMGDNRAVAMDSRLQEIGTIPKNRIIGKVLFSFG